MLASKSTTEGQQGADNTEELENQVASLKSTLESTSAQLNATAGELRIVKEAFDNLKDAYNQLKVSGSEDTQLLSAYEDTIADLLSRMAFLSDYLSAEIGMSVDTVADHAIPKMRGLYLDMQAVFRKGELDPSLYRGPNGDVRLHNIKTIEMYPTLFYAPAGSDWTTMGVTSSGSNAGTASFNLKPGGYVRLQANHPVATTYAEIKQTGTGAGYINPPRDYTDVVEERVFFPSWTLIEFDEDFDPIAFFLNVAITGWRRYNDNGTAYGGYHVTGHSYHEMASVSVIPIRKNVFAFQVVGSSDSHAGCHMCDLGFRSNADINVTIKSVNQVYLPMPNFSSGVPVSAVAGKYNATMGHLLKPYNDKMRVV